MLEVRTSSRSILHALPFTLSCYPTLDTSQSSAVIQQSQWRTGTNLPKNISIAAPRAKTSLTVLFAGDTESASKRRHVIITGGNSGIGKATAMELAKQGMAITMACRSKEKGDVICSEISRLSGNPQVRAMVCDLASFKSVRNFVKDYKEQKFPLHVLVNNAGIMACPQLYTEEGFEMQFGVNHLGHFLLTALLLETLAESASPGSFSRVVILASAAERIGNIDFTDLNFKGSRGYNPWISYGQSKLANCLFSYELSQRCKAAGLKVTANCLHPGIVDTKLIRYTFPQLMGERSILLRLRSFILKILGLKTPEEGASTVLHLVSSKLLEGVSGYYFEDCRIKDPSSQAKDSKLATKLWEVSEKLTDTSDLLLGLGLNNTSVGVRV